MTLSEMAQFVCRKVRATDADALLRCREFLRKRYEMVAKDELWNDLLYSLAWTWEVPKFTLVPAADPEATPPTLLALGDFSLTNPADTNVSLPGWGNWFSRRNGIWHLPPTVDRVLALRMSQQPLAVMDEFQMYRQSLAAFEATGVPLSFHTLGQVVMDCSAERELWRPLADGWQAGGALWFSTASQDVSVSVTVRFIDVNGETVSRTLPVLYQQFPDVGAMLQPVIILDITTDGSAVPILAWWQAYFVLNGESHYFSPLPDASPIVINPGETAARRCPRIRVYPIPTVDTPMRALVKLKPRVLSNDHDEAEIRGIDNCLLALAQGDMLERGRQYGKARGKFQEGLALLEQAKKAHTWHEARNQQITPEVQQVSGQAGGMGGPWGW